MPEPSQCEKDCINGYQSKASQAVGDFLENGDREALIEALESAQIGLVACFKNCP